MPNTTSVGVTPRVCAEAPAAGSNAAAAIASPRAIVDLFIDSSLPSCNCIELACLGIHAVDHRPILLVHELALELHRRRQFIVLGGELLLDQPELLDRFDAREALVHALDLRPDQVADLTGPAERGKVGEGHVVVL